MPLISMIVGSSEVENGRYLTYTSATVARSTGTLWATIGGRMLHGQWQSGHLFVSLANYSQCFSVDILSGSWFRRRNFRDRDG